MSREESPDLQSALRRQYEENARWMYQRSIQSEKQHLKECKAAKCLKCRDARALIPYYRERMKEELRDLARRYPIVEPRQEVRQARAKRGRRSRGTF